MYDEKYYKERLPEKKEIVEDDVSFIKTLNVKTILEVGCAKGLLLVSLKKNGFYVDGIDISDDFVKNSYLKIKKADICDYKSKKKYDLVICFEILEHISKEKLKTACRNVSDLSKKFILIHSPWKKEKDPDPTHVTIKPKFWWKKQFREFKEEKIKYHSFDNYIDDSLLLVRT